METPTLFQGLLNSGCQFSAQEWLWQPRPWFYCKIPDFEISCLSCASVFPAQVKQILGSKWKPEQSMKGRQVATGVLLLPKWGNLGNAPSNLRICKRQGASSALTGRWSYFRKPFISFFITKSIFSCSFSLLLHRAIGGSLFFSAPSRSRINN